LGKYEPSQEGYFTTYNYANASSLSIPVTNSRPSETGLVVEALAAESMYTLTPAYYDIALERKYMRDEESREMLDIITVLADRRSRHNIQLGRLVQSVRDDNPEKIKGFHKRVRENKGQGRYGNIENRRKIQLV